MVVKGICKGAFMLLGQESKLRKEMRIRVCGGVNSEKVEVNQWIVGHASAVLLEVVKE